jgi:hypothetical protein
VAVKSVDEPTSPSGPGNDKVNTHLTIRTILAASALATVIGMTSALSVARAGEVDAPVGRADTARRGANAIPKR